MTFVDNLRYFFFFGWNMGDKQPQAPKQAKTKQEPQKPKPKSNFSTIPSTTIDSATSEKSEQNNHNHNHNHNKPDKVREGERQNRRPRYPDKVPNHLDVNKNLPKEAKFTMVEEHDPEDDKFDFDNLLTEQVGKNPFRTHLTISIVHLYRFDEN